MQSLLNQKPAEAKVKKLETDAECFERLRREEQENFVTVEVATTPYERAQTGQATRLVQVDRKQYEDEHGITGLRTLWAKTPEEIQAMSNNPVERVKMVDGVCQFPRTSTPVEMTEENATKFTQQAQAFLDSKNLSADDRDRLLLFVAINADSNSTIDISNPEIWNIAYRRLIELGCISSEPNQSTLAPTEKSFDDMTDAEARDTVTKDYLENQAGPLWNSLLDYFSRQFNVYLNDLQKRALIDYVVSHGLQCLDHEAWNSARRALVKSGVLPAHCLLADEVLAERVERGEFGDLNLPANKQKYLAEKNRLVFQEGQSIPHA
jgi:hypothetical protein